MPEMPKSVTPYLDSDADNVKTAVKTTPGTIWVIECSNPNSADAYIQLFDAATGDVTVGTTAPTQTYLVPAGDGTNAGGFLVTFPAGMFFTTAITHACTTTATGAGDPTTGLILNIVYT